MAPKNLAELAENFALFDGWEDRYRYLIELGGRLEPFPEHLRTDEHIVRGCTSRVWMVAGIRDGVFHFVADSDAQIVRGLIYLLVLAYQDKSVPEVTSYDIAAAFEALGLNQHLSPNRRNGFFAMVEKIRAIAAAGANQ